MMTLFWRLCFVFFGMMAYTEAFLPENIKDSIDHLNNHYVRKNLHIGKVHDGPSIFLNKLNKKFEEGEQKLLMAVILDTYDRILSRMENETQDDKVKQDLHEVKEQMKKLKEHYFLGKLDDIKNFVIQLLALKENDPQIQSKAIFELKSIYNKAANMGSLSAENLRKRRQAKGSKKQRS